MWDDIRTCYKNRNVTKMDELNRENIELGKNIMYRKK